MFDVLPDSDVNLAYELVKKLVLACAPDFNKLTSAERARFEDAENDPETVSNEDINWD